MYVIAHKRIMSALFVKVLLVTIRNQIAHEIEHTYIDILLRQK